MKDNAGHVNDTTDEFNGDIRAVNLSWFQEKAEIHHEIQNEYFFSLKIWFGKIVLTLSMTYENESDRKVAADRFGFCHWNRVCILNAAPFCKMPGDAS